MKVNNFYSQHTHVDDSHRVFFNVCKNGNIKPGSANTTSAFSKTVMRISLVAPLRSIMLRDGRCAFSIFAISVTALRTTTARMAAILECPFIRFLETSVVIPHRESRWNSGIPEFRILFFWDPGYFFLMIIFLFPGKREYVI